MELCTESIGNRSDIGSGSDFYLYLDLREVVLSDGITIDLHVLSYNFLFTFACKVVAFLPVYFLG